VIEHPRPVPGTTVSVLDGTVAPAPRPTTVISVGDSGGAVRPSADVVVAQTGPDTVDVTMAGRTVSVDVEFFRAENRYVSMDSVTFDAELEMAD